MTSADDLPVEFHATDVAVGYEEDFSILQFTDSSRPDVWLTVMLPPSDEFEPEPGDLYVELCDQRSSAGDDQVAFMALERDVLTIRLREGVRARLPRPFAKNDTGTFTSLLRVHFSVGAELLERIRQFLIRARQYGTEVICDFEDHPPRSAG